MPSRPSGRADDELRSIHLEPAFSKYAEGSCMARFGDTHVLCTASVETSVPPFLRNTGRGWVTAEYGMLPRATHERTAREAARGRQGGRTLEIQRLVGRSLRAVIDLAALGERQVRVDCDVIQADGGTRTASVTGGYVALALAVRKMLADKLIARNPLRGSVAAVSCGLVAGMAVLDLDYLEDFDRPGRRQLRDDRRERAGRGAGHRRGRSVQPRPVRPADDAGRARHPPAHRNAGKGAGDGMSRRFAGGRLIIASHNPGKVREIAELLEPHGADVVSAGALGLPEPEETGTTFVANAELKARAAAAASGLASLADDSGLAVDALDGAPGIYSARWAGPAKDFDFAMRRVNDELGDRDRAARFVCALALAWPDGHCDIFEGTVAGTLVWPPRGGRGFGYDPMFLPAGGAETFGEMDPAAKHAISHRADAFRKLVAACFS